MFDRQTIVSAPGKVLIAGGYLVLDAAYPGLVIATTARFYTIIESASNEASSSSSPAASGSKDGHTFQVSIKSPQFVEARWDFIVNLSGTGIVQQTVATWSNPNAGYNPFISLALLYSIRLCLEARSQDEMTEVLQDQGLDIRVLADNDFYSQRVGKEASSSDHLRSLPPFQSQNRPIRQVHKTGLGSSAAMTTSLVGALLIHFGLVQRDETIGRIDDASLALIHNTAQLAHCAAQGKVGSGFDVSAAVWGSQLYRRFDKSVVQPLLDAGEKVGPVGASADTLSSREVPELAPYLDPRNPLWHASPLSSAQPGNTNPTAIEGLAAGLKDEIEIARPAPLELPPYVKLVLADVDAGSNTPSMVGKILKWRQEKQEWANQMYKVLASGNQTLADGLLALRLTHAQDSEEYISAIKRASVVASKTWEEIYKSEPSPTVALLIEVRNAMRSIQGGMRELGRQADVPVEPNEMGNVIRATVDGASGVLGGGVPGAGGYDALFILYLDAEFENNSSTAREAIEKVWSDWTALSVGPLLSSAGGAAGVTSAAIQAQSALLPNGVPKLAPSQGQGGLLIHPEGSVAGLAEAIALSQ